MKAATIVLWSALLFSLFQDGQCVKRRYVPAFWEMFFNDTPEVDSTDFMKLLTKYDYATTSGQSVQNAITTALTNASDDGRKIKRDLLIAFEITHENDLLIAWIRAYKSRGKFD